MTYLLNDLSLTQILPQQIDEDDLKTVFRLFAYVLYVSQKKMFEEKHG